MYCPPARDSFCFNAGDVGSGIEENPGRFMRVHHEDPVLTVTVAKNDLTPHRAVDDVDGCPPIDDKATRRVAVDPCRPIADRDRERVCHYRPQFCRSLQGSGMQAVPASSDGRCGSRLGTAAPAKIVSGVGAAATSSSRCSSMKLVCVSPLRNEG